MRFYDALQLDPAGLWDAIRGAETKKEKRKMQVAIVVRPMLIVAFAIALIAPMTTFFGAENNAMTVGLFCILLSIRFVDFGYCIKDSMINLAIVFALLLLAPVAAAQVPPLVGFLIHFVAMGIILSMTCIQPEMGNGGLYGFAYVFLAGNPVTGESFINRCWVTLIGFLVCGAIFYAKHRRKHQGIRFLDQAGKFSLASAKNRWQLRLSLGVSLLLLIGAIFELKQWVWAGFACSSLLSYYNPNGVRERYGLRIAGTILGSVAFFVVYQITPPTFHSLFGPLCGVVLGFCVDYKYKTAINCFSALLLAAGLYGLGNALLLRIANNLLGVAFACVFGLIYQLLISRRYETPEAAL